MLLPSTTLKCQVGEYNFLSDPSLGVIGTVGLGVHIPKFAQIMGFWGTELVNLTSGGPCSIAFGTVTTDTAIPVLSTASLLVPVDITAFTSQPKRGVDLYSAPLRIFNTADVIMTIADSDLTGGRIRFVVWYNEFLQ